VISSLEDREGRLWFGTVGDGDQGAGVSCYDGQHWTTFTTADGLAHNRVKWITQDREGNLWFGTAGGVSRYDGKSWTTFTTADGLAGNWVEAMLQDRQGHLWVATRDGVSCYDGKRWTAFTTQHGLPASWATAVFQDQQGYLWFGTYNGGVSCCDGQVFQVLDQQDGLAGNIVWGIHQDEEGRLWFTTENGATCYRPSALEPPGVCIDAVIANRRYEQFEALVLPSRSGLVAFEFHGTSLTARPGALVFRYCLEGCDAEWRTTRAGRVEYPDLSPGLYTFQVQAVDQRMQYSPLAEVGFRVRDPQEERIEELEAQVRARTQDLEEKNRQLEAANRALEEANQQVQQATQRKSQFLSRMSHDLRTPMNAIIGYTRILLRKTKDALDERQYRNLENIQLSADHLLSLINDILDLSRIEAGRIDLKPEPVDLKQLVARCAASVESLLKPGVELKQDLAELTPLHTDPDRLSRVLMNLLSNAVKFTQQGSITVSVKPVDGQVELSVADTGVGIPAEDLPYIFEEFRQSGRRGEGEKQGSGLGLAIARKSVELLGGSIAVESELGKGTRFTLKLRNYGL
jgi:signal transduction histidine kinase